MTYTIDSLMEMWSSMFPDKPLNRSQFALWMMLNGADITYYGIKATAKKYVAMNCNMDKEYLVRYASGCMRNRKFNTAIQQMEEE